MTRRTAFRALIGGAVVLTVAPLLAACDGAVFYQMAGMVLRDDSGRITVGGEMDVFDLVVGDCFDEREQTGARVSEDGIQTVTAVPCDEPHTYEVFHDFEMPNGPYPGDDAVGLAADNGCYGAFAGFVGQPYEDSPLEYWYYTPLESGWDGTDRDRLITCFIGDEGVLVSGSAKDAGRQSS